jgi:hypothetical protein
MQAVSHEQFLRWAADRGVTVDPRYPDSGCLRLVPVADHARFWVVPTDVTTSPRFFTSLLDGLDEWATGLLWPRSGRWPRHGSSQSYDGGVRDVVLRGAGIPNGWSGAVRFNRNEGDALVALLFAYMAFGWCVDDDLFFLPEHAQQLVQTDHHGVIHAECKSEGRILRLVEHMAAEGYDLPANPPDATFRWPAWMNNPDAL